MTYYCKRLEWVCGDSYSVGFQSQPGWLHIRKFSLTHSVSTRLAPKTSAWITSKRGWRSESDLALPATWSFSAVAVDGFLAPRSFHSRAVGYTSRPEQALAELSVRYVHLGHLAHLALQPSNTSQRFSEAFRTHGA